MQEEADRKGLSVITESKKKTIIHGVTCYHGALNRKGNKAEVKS